MSVNIGLDDAKRQEIASKLAGVLADTYALYFKTHTYHWNVTGPHFNTLHTMFEAQYTELWSALDVIAERIRALGALAPNSFGELQGLQSLTDDDNSVPKAPQMAENLLAGQEHLIRSMREVLGFAAEAGDDATADLLTQRVDASEKTAWMLRAFLD